MIKFPELTGRKILPFPVKKPPIIWVRKWKKGDKVNHALFGTGVIIRADGIGKKEWVAVDFGRYGTKQLILAYTKLQRP